MVSDYLAHGFPPVSNPLDVKIDDRAFPYSLTWCILTVCRMSCVKSDAHETQAKKNKRTGYHMGMREVKLDDKYTLLNGRIFVTGIQALVRLPMLQKLLDQRAGLNTGGYISGYRGSPLGALDQQLVRAEQFLKLHDIVFQPGVNEELAATACSGTQQINLQGQGAYDGVFSMWYGKGPGVDRIGDALRHANNFGTAEHGGMLALLGDDHACESSTTAHQSEYAMVDAMIPVLNPASVQEILDYGLYGFAMSRYTGGVVSYKCVHDTVEATASVEVSEDRTNIIIPTDFDMPADGLNIRAQDTFLEQEHRVHYFKTAAAQAFTRANKLDQLTINPASAWLGVVTTGKSYLDVRQAFVELGIDDNTAQQLGIRVYKIAMSWPIEPEGVARFAHGLQSIVVVEEKRGLIEDQLRSLLYANSNAPQIEGKRDSSGQVLFPSTARLNATDIAIKLGARIVSKTANNAVSDKLTRLREIMQAASARQAPAMIRTPYFCAGCPHNTGTLIPEGSVAKSGIGCHFMVQWMDRNTAGYTQMGGEGASWVGEAPFSNTKHIFQNIGDGTYYHSGLLAVRSAIASKVNVTFKILYNDAVAMTGGQPMDGPLTPLAIAQQVHAEGATRVTVVTDEPDKYPHNAPWPPDLKVHHRDNYDQVQREFREISGTSVIIYDQTCAAEKRRRRKRGEFPDPPKRLFINEDVCEGCGDCGVASNCVAVLPHDTPLGRKRRIDQSACNKDYSCVNGFCPSFVTIHGGSLRRKTQSSHTGANWTTPLPEASWPALTSNCGIVLTGVGGTGVVTIGAIIGMAAHIARLGCSILDMMGLAQKGGSVTSHIIVAPSPEDITATHIAAGRANVILGCDIVTAAANPTLDRIQQGATKAIINTHQMMSGDFTRDRNAAFPKSELQSAISTVAGDEHCHFINATQLAEELLGNTIGANMLMLGFAWQCGVIPIPREAIEKAIALNGQAVDMNTQAFLWGRRAAFDRTAVETLATPAIVINTPEKFTARNTYKLKDILADRIERLTDYQNRRYAMRYKKLVEYIAEQEARITPGQTAIATNVAKNLYKLMAYKDEYEVARLTSNGSLQAAIAAQFEGEYRVHYNLAPPVFSRKDKVTGHLIKREYGPSIQKLFTLLTKFKSLRGTPVDIFSYSAERRTEKAMIKEYEALIRTIASDLSPTNHALAVEIVSLADQVRGFGHVKMKALEKYQQDMTKLQAMWPNNLTHTTAVA